MHPVLFTISIPGNDILIGSYGVLVVIGATAGTGIATRIAIRFGYSAREFFSTAIITVCGGFIGALLAGFFVFFPERMCHGFLAYPLVLVSWGGMAGGFITLLILKYTWSLNVLDVCDIAVPAALIGFGIGRIGCHLAGCCYGITAESFPAVTFTHPLAPASIMNQPLVPTQLISACVLLVMGGALYVMVRYRRRTGSIFFLSLVLYGIFRFAIEFWRSDPRGFILGLSDGQVFSMVIILAGIIGLARIIN